MKGVKDKLSLESFEKEKTLTKHEKENDELRKESKIKEKFLFEM